MAKVEGSNPFIRFDPEFSARLSRTVSCGALDFLIVEIRKIVFDPAITKHGC